MSPLPLRSLEAFVVAARALSLTRAAATLNMTVPAASRRIKILESHLGVRLFDRLPRGLALTAAGERYFAELGPAWDAMRAATEAARTPAPRKAFRVSVIPTFAANWLVPRLARDHAALAGLEIELETAPDIVDLTERRDLDCAIRLGRGPWPGTVGRKVLPVSRASTALRRIPWSGPAISPISGPNGSGSPHPAGTSRGIATRASTICSSSTKRRPRISESPSDSILSCGPISKAAAWSACGLDG